MTTPEGFAGVNSFLFSDSRHEQVDISPYLWFKPAQFHRSPFSCLNAARRKLKKHMS
jgi:hypothetical protein